MGILLASTLVTTCKLLQEAKRCLKCQKFSTSHLAAQCPQTTDTCGTCGSKNHHTQACKVSGPAQYHCTNCNKLGHTSWDRNCSISETHNNRLQQKNQETNMHFYPSSRDPQSWEAASPMNEEHHSPVPPTLTLSSSKLFYFLMQLQHSSQHQRRTNQPRLT